MAVAALAPLVISKGVQARQDAAQAVKNDIAVIRTTRTSGKGKKKHTTDYEVHVNPVSLAVGGAVVVGGTAAALWLSGMGVSRQTGTMNAYTITRYREGVAPVAAYTDPAVWEMVKVYEGDPANDKWWWEKRQVSPEVYHEEVKEVKPVWVMRNMYGVPIRYINHEPALEDVLTPNQIARGWSVEEFIFRNEVYLIKIKNDRKRQFTIGQRPRFTIFGSSTDGGTPSVWDVIFSPGKDWKW
jgi:hypothetical protein